MADWGIYTLISVYISPNAPMVDFEKWLDELADCINQRTARPKIVAGDFNSKSQMWGSARTDTRGRAVEKWAAQSGLTLINTGKVSTCVRQGGESIIDLTWASPAAARKITGWRVAEDRETLSDHKMIEFTLSPSVINQDMRTKLKRTEKEPRWATKKLDTDRLGAAIEAALWTQNWEGLQNLPERVKWVQDLMMACDLAMPRTKVTNKRPAYWWSDELAQLRRLSVHANRTLSRARRSGDAQRVEQAWQEDCEANTGRGNQKGKGRCLGRSSQRP